MLATRWRRGAWPVAAALALLVGGCATTMHLVPAPSAQSVPGQKLSAMAEKNGVRVIVRGDSWSGSPADLSDEVTVLKVSIRNDSSNALRIRYDGFMLTSNQGVSYAVLPPYKITGSAPGAPVSPEFAHSGFYLAPGFAPYYYGLPPWGAGWAYDPFFYSTYWPMWGTQRIQLPTRDMRQKAIPEGVLERGGHLSGYLYFPYLRPGTRSANFNMQLVNAKDQKSFGSIEIPFEVK